MFISECNWISKFVGEIKMNNLKHLFFKSALDVCDFANTNNVQIKHVAIKATENHHGVADITYVVFYEEKEE